ncbi:hypothetical protein ACKLNR_010105 [Fusarium oxysporum f. sp. zingiberi]
MAATFLHHCISTPDGRTVIVNFPRFTPEFTTAARHLKRPGYLKLSPSLQERGIAHNILRSYPSYGYSNPQYPYCRQTLRSVCG